MRYSVKRIHATIEFTGLSINYEELRVNWLLIAYKNVSFLCRSPDEVCNCSSGSQFRLRVIVAILAQKTAEGVSQENYLEFLYCRLCNYTGRLLTNYDVARRNGLMRILEWIFVCLL